jgi:hypothetical protein
LNLAFDLASLISDIWKNQTFKAIDSIAICANCKLRKIFTLKNLPNADYGLTIDDTLIPVDFPEGTASRLQVNIHLINSWIVKKINFFNWFHPIKAF